MGVRLAEWSWPVTELRRLNSSRVLIDWAPHRLSGQVVIDRILILFGSDLPCIINLDLRVVLRFAKLISKIVFCQTIKRS